jgi:hypothetical protein
VALAYINGKKDPKSVKLGGASSPGRDHLLNRCDNANVIKKTLDSEFRIQYSVCRIKS